MKVKEVEIGDQKYRIGSLTVDQYEQFIGDGISTKGKEFIRQHMVPVVAASLENAAQGNGKWFVQPSANGSPKRTWAEEDVSAQLDFGELDKLYSAIIELSGLKTSGAKPGEPAAAASQPGSSAAA